VYKDGALSPLLGKIEVGGFVEMLGPMGIHRYTAKTSTFSCGPSKKWESVKNIAMIAGGTGITPMLQIINSVLRISKKMREKRGMSLKLLVFATEVDEIMLEEELKELVHKLDGILSVRDERAKRASCSNTRNDALFVSSEQSALLSLYS